MSGTAFQRSAANKFQRGTAVLELAFLLTFLLLLVLGVIDFARAFYLGIEVSNAARAGAIYGQQNPGTAMDDSGMQNAAQNDAVDVPGFTASASHGWSCASDLSTPVGSPGSCSAGQAMMFVKVQATATYSPLIPWPGIPRSFPLSSTKTMWTGQQ